MHRLVLHTNNYQYGGHAVNSEGGTNMPKLKTNKAATKRFKMTGTGKLKRMKTGKQHILTKKSSKTKRNLRKATMTDKTNEKNMKKILPYL